MTEFVGLREKMYSLKCKKEELSMKNAKGVRKYVVRNTIHHDHFKNEARIVEIFKNFPVNKIDWKHVIKN